jgi:hypothetical protein
LFDKIGAGRKPCIFFLLNMKFNPDMDKKLILKFFTAIGIVLGIFPLLALPSYALADSFVDSNGNISCTGIVEVIQTIIDWVFILSGIAFFLIMLLGGFMYMMSAGNPDGVQRAQQTLFWGVIGTLITVFMVFIATTIIEEAFGVGDATPILNISAWICG